jgi:hypothetical protein
MDPNLGRVIIEGRVVIKGRVINSELTQDEVMVDLRGSLQAFNGEHVRVTIERVEQERKSGGPE